MKERSKLFIAVLIGLVLGAGITGLWLSRSQTPPLPPDNTAPQLALAIQNGNLVPLMTQVLDQTFQEHQANPEGPLSEGTLTRITAVSQGFAPYVQGGEAHNSTQRYSPDRGQFLLALAAMNLDSASFQRIKLRATFAGANLPHTNLWGANLSYANLDGANLQESDLNTADLTQVSLNDANFWGAQLRKIQAQRASFKRSNLSWTDLTGADLHKAEMDGSTLTNAKFAQSDLSHAQAKWAYWDGVRLQGANLTHTDFYGTSLIQANLSQTNCKWANLRRTHLTDADLSGANLAKATVEEENWMELIVEWRVKGADEILQNYVLVKDSAGPTYRLEVKSE